MLIHKYSSIMFVPVKFHNNVDLGALIIYNSSHFLCKLGARERKVARLRPSSRTQLPQPKEQPSALNK